MSAQKLSSNTLQHLVVKGRELARRLSKSSQREVKGNRVGRGRGTRSRGKRVFSDGVFQPRE